MRNLRIGVLFVATALSMCLLAWKWLSQRGLVTLNFSDAPLSRVIQSIERQGMVEIRTNADPAMPVTMRLNRAPAFEAIETLAVRINADARLAYIAAPRGDQIAEILVAFSSGANLGGWSVFSPGFAGRLVFGDASSLDPRQIEWKVSQDADRSLQALLDQGAQKTGAVFAVPADWNPVLATLPPTGRVGKVTADLLRSTKGRVKEVFLLTINPRRRDDPKQAEWADTQRLFSVQRSGQQENAHWAAERVQAQIALLPEDDRIRAREVFDETRAFWESIRGLPDEERRARIEEYMSRPEVQLRVEERATVRDARRTPEQREQRYRNYIRHKEQIKGAPTRS
jgi:hypothetical protein